MSCAEKLQSGSGWSDTSVRIPEGVRDSPYSQDDDTDDDLDSTWGVDAEAEITPDYYSDGESQFIRSALADQPQSPSIQSPRPNRVQSNPVRFAPVYQPQTPLCIVRNFPYNPLSC